MICFLALKSLLSKGRDNKCKFYATGQSMTKFIRAAVSLWEWLQVLEKNYPAFIWERKTFEGWEIMRIKTGEKLNLGKNEGL